MSRTIDDVKTDYANAAYALGHVSFQLREAEAQLERMDQEARKYVDKLRHLNKEALKLQSEAPKVEEVPSEVK